jgi:thioredoxin-related protein
VVRIIKDTGPSWWNDVKVENGSRLVVVFREQEGCFYSNKIKREQKKKKQQQGAASSEKKRSETKRK